MVADLPLATATNESTSDETPITSPDDTGEISVSSSGSDPKEAVESEDSEEEDEELRDYFVKLKQTEGFYDGERPKGRFWGGVSSALPERLSRVDECVDFVIEEHNKKPEWGMELQLSEILRANCSPCAGANYYITFSAVDLSTGEAAKEYETRVYACWDGHKETSLFREKGISKQDVELYCDLWVDWTDLKWIRSKIPTDRHVILSHVRKHGDFFSAYVEAAHNIKNGHKFPIQLSVIMAKEIGPYDDDMNPVDEQRLIKMVV
ncbi:hypothetical protein LINPERHAP1_LOCUS9585 [Linum perenne]